MPQIGLICLILLYYVLEGERYKCLVIGSVKLRLSSRFDRMLYLGVSDTQEAQLKIIEALTRKFKLAPSTDLRAVAEACPFNYTGADFYALCSDAMLKAMARKAEEVDEKIGKSALACTLACRLSYFVTSRTQCKARLRQACDHAAILPSRARSAGGDPSPGLATRL